MLRRGRRSCSSRTATRSLWRGKNFCHCLHIFVIELHSWWSLKACFGRRTRMAGLEILLGNICSAQYAMCSVLLIYHLYRLQRLQISEVTSCAYPIQLARFSGIEQSANPFWRHYQPNTGMLLDCQFARATRFWVFFSPEQVAVMCSLVGILFSSESLFNPAN